MSTSLQAPAGATAPNAWIQSQTLLSVLAVCSQHRQAWGVTWAQPRSHMPKYFGEARLESQGQYIPVGAQRGWHWARGSSGKAPQTPTALRGWGGSFPASPTNPPPVLVLQMQCPYHIYFCNLFYVIRIIFVFLLLGQLCKTEGVIKPCRDKQPLLLNQKS